MRHTPKVLLAGAAAIVFAACTANAEARSASRARIEVVKIKKVKKIVHAPVQHEYENVAGFRGQLHDPLYSYAAEPSAVVAPEPMGPPAPVITQWPMPNTVWW